jgi:type I restriction enzyme S subunit
MSRVVKDEPTRRRGGAEEDQGAAVKAGWKEKPVGEILRLEYGKPLDEAFRKPDGRYPVYGANGEKDRTDKFYYEKHSIIVGRKGSAGEINLTENKFWPLDVTYFVTFDERQHNLRFLYYLLTTLDLPSLAKGVKPGINRNEVYSRGVKVPPLAEQQRIVAILDEAFDGIATAKANAEKNLQNARSLFESHLQSVFTQDSKGWEQKTLKQIATTFGRGKSKHRPRNEKKLYGGKYPFIQTGDIRNASHYITEYSQTYSEAGLAQSKLWPKGTICITIAANIAETGILGFDACFPDSVIGVVANPKEAGVGFVEYLLQSFKVRLQSKGKGSAQANINLGTFENLQFPFPSVTEQKTIVTKLDTLRAETQRLESIFQRKLAALDELKKSLLHQAFTGQLTMDKG